MYTTNGTFKSIVPNAPGGFCFYDWNLKPDASGVWLEYKYLFSQDYCPLGIVYAIDLRIAVAKKTRSWIRVEYKGIYIVSGVKITGEPELIYEENDNGEFAIVIYKERPVIKKVAVRKFRHVCRIRCIKV